MKYRSSLVGLILVLAVSFASPVFAQEDSEVILGIDSGFWSLSTSSTSSTLATGLTIMTVQGFRNSRASADTFVRHNAVALQQDLHLGGGQTTADLAALLGVKDDELLAFQGYLFEHRAELTELLSTPELTEELLTSFWEVVLAAPVELLG